MSLLSHMGLVPSFSPYTGPYQVGTQEYEIPSSELSENAGAGPDPQVATINFRIFYPCVEQKKKSAPVYWLPSPQTEYFRAYMRFLQASTWMNILLSYSPIAQLLHHTTVPVHQNAPLLDPKKADLVSQTLPSRWPVLIFSHGIGGSKNAYSNICGSLASYGIVVVAPEHRDGSVPVSFVRATPTTEAKTINYKQIGPKGVETIADGQRDEMIRIRCWEIGLLYNTLLKLDEGTVFTNLSSDPFPNSPSFKSPSFTAPSPTFQSLLNIHTPGAVAFAGHSFGAASTIQFLKSVHHSSEVLLPASATSSALKGQITPNTPFICLDLWALPLQSPATAPLLSQPLPCYSSTVPQPPLALFSRQFYKWTSGLKATFDVLSSPGSTVAPRKYPLAFYAENSIHLSQSDFGPLFPWFNRRFFKAMEPDRIVWLNVRAMIAYLRRCGGDSWAGIREVDLAKFRDAEDENVGKGTNGAVVNGNAAHGGDSRERNGKAREEKGEGDWRILDAEGGVRGWIGIDGAEVI